jgi:hypothetical protein
MGSSDRFNQQVYIFLGGGSNRGAEIQSPDGFFGLRWRMLVVDSPDLTFFMMAQITVFCKVGLL